MNTLNKLTILLLLAALMSSSIAFGQDGLIKETNLNDCNVTKHLVQSYNHPLTVHYYEDCRGGHFLLSDFNSTSICVNMDSVSVNDFIIMSDSVFFCGIANNGLGAVGFFDINDYFYNSHDFYFYKNINIASANKKAQSLNRIVAYHDSHNMPHIVSIGTTDNGEQCIVDNYIDYSFYVWYYLSGYIEPPSQEILTDLAVTNSFVVTSGLTDLGGTGYSLRVHPRDYIFPSSGVQDYAYHFVNSRPIKGNVFVDEFQANRVGVMAMTKNIDSSGYYYNYLGFVGLGTMISNHNSCVSDNLESRMMYYGGSWEIREFLIDPITKKILTLQEANPTSASTTESMFSVIDYPATYSLSYVEYFPGDTYMDVDFSSNLSKYVFVGRPKTHKFDIYQGCESIDYVLPQQGSANDCLKRTSYENKQIDYPIVTKNHSEYTSWAGFSNIIHAYSNNVSNPPIFRHCDIWPCIIVSDETSDEDNQE